MNLGNLCPKRHGSAFYEKVAFYSVKTEGLNNYYSSKKVIKFVVVKIFLQIKFVFLNMIITEYCKCFILMCVQSLFFIAEKRLKDTLKNCCEVYFLFAKNFLTNIFQS